MVGVEQLEQVVESLWHELTPAYVQARVGELLREGEDVGGGVNAFRLMRHLLGEAAQTDEQVMWAYERLKPALGAALEQVPTLYYLYGD
jgi:hypothetical protein